MKRAVTAVVALSSVAHAARTPLHSRDQYEALFYDWMLEHDITIPVGPEYVLRLNNFIDNNDHIELQNGKNLTYTLAHNHFSHLSFEEFQQKYLGWERPLRLAEPEPVAVMRRSLRRTVAHTLATVDDGMDDAALEKLLPKSVDWVAKGAVSSVKDQGQCGSCYTFSATGAVEGAYAIKHGKMVELSMQQVVDCDNLDGGCAGGEMTNVFKWIRQNGGLCALTDYPYSSGTTEKQDVCHKCQVVAGTAPSSWKMVFPGSDVALRAALTKGPVSVAVGASKDWMFYKEGIFNGQCEAQLNHGILAVGYDETADGKFWKVKNSWSQNWGMDGYILLSRDDKSESCGVLQDSSYPILSDASSAYPADALVEPVAVVEAVESGFRRGSASSKDCGGGTAVFDTINITPDDIAKNQLITLEASGILNKPTTDGTYRLSVVFAGGELYSHSGSLCGKEKVELPLGVGVVNIYGLDCPAMPGPVTYGLDVKLPVIAPSGTYEIKITGNDQDGVPAVCIDTTLSI